MVQGVAAASRSRRERERERERDARSKSMSGRGDRYAGREETLNGGRNPNKSAATAKNKDNTKSKNSLSAAVSNAAKEVSTEEKQEKQEKLRFGCLPTCLLLF